MKQAARAADPVAASQPAGAGHGRTLQRRCSGCGSRQTSGARCETCAKKKRAQAKLIVGSTSDRYEVEADRIAGQVVAGLSSNAVATPSPVAIQRMVGEPEGVEVPESAVLAGRSGTAGSAMEPQLRRDMERRFGHDFSRVRIHADAAADASARMLGADAYTVGNDIAFASGKYAPHHRHGQHLLAHELTHVVQQSGAPGGAGSGLVFRHAKDRTTCLNDPDWKRIDASPQDVYGPANDAIERAYKDAHPGSGVLTGSQFESGGKPGSSGIELPKGAPNKGSCDKLLGEFKGVSRQLAPDIMDCTERVFYEIKTNQFAGKGAEQILSYYKLANELAAQAGEPAWQIESAGWYPPHVLMLEPTRRVCTEGTDYSRTQRPGLIIYEVQDHKDRKKRKEEEEEKEKKEKEEKERKTKEEQAAAALRRVKLSKVKEFVDQLEREVDMAEGENRLQRNLINKPSYFGFWGFWTNELFNTQPPLSAIWDNAYSGITSARVQIKAGNPEKALQRFVEARIAYLEAQRVYQKWKEGLPGAAAKMQTAIVVGAVLALAAFVAPTVVARAASTSSGGASTAANLAAAEKAVAQAGVRIAAGESQIAAKGAAITELEIVTAAELEAEMFVLRLMRFP